MNPTGNELKEEEEGDESSFWQWVLETNREMFVNPEEVNLNNKDIKPRERGLLGYFPTR